MTSHTPSNTTSVAEAYLPSGCDAIYLSPGSGKSRMLTQSIYNAKVRSGMSYQDLHSPKPLASRRTRISLAIQHIPT